jgi:hypothetical protein
MAREEPANPMIWILVQIAEFMIVIAVLPRLLPDGMAGWLAAVVWVLVIAGAFVLNLRVVMPWIDHSRSGSDPGDDDTQA